MERHEPLGLALAASLAKRLACSVSLAACALLFAGPAVAHGDAAPQPVDTGNLPALGTDKWLPDDPFRSGEHKDEAIEVGARGYNANCARCHGLEAVSGGIAPDVRKLNQDCGGDEACIKEMDGYFLETVRHGRTRDGRVYMPPFEGIMSQEAMLAIRTYIDSRPAPE